MKKKLFNSLVIIVFLFGGNLIAQNNTWSKTTVKENAINVSLKNLDPENFDILQLDINSLKQQLTAAPLRGVSNGKSNTIVNFPLLNGKTLACRIVETAIFSSQDNAAQHPGIKTYLGSSTDGSGTRVRFSVTPLGLKAMLSQPGKEAVFIQPVTKVSNGQYIVYNRTAKTNAPDAFQCLTEDVDISKLTVSSKVSRDANDQLLRTFRMAMSASATYTSFWDDGNAANGDAQQDALAALVSTLNRTNEVFEVDMAITFQLVDTVDDPALDIIYSGSDPYGGDYNAGLMTNLTSVVGLADFDIGHVLVEGGNNGNAGCIGCVCEDTVNSPQTEGKGSGFSSHGFTDNDGGPFMSDFFDIDYVPHEIGHQMGANHTFSFSTESAGVNSEPGSGTTIMGYAGITGSDDVQDHSDPYFHYQSINQILNTVTTGANTCAVTTNITNSPPVANAGADFSIPNGTAFILKASATDADGGDVLTYTWEQTDSGQTSDDQFGPTHTGGPVWRSRPPSTDTDRYMPIYSRVLTGDLTETNPVETLDNSSWETVSTVARTLNFALTVRDRAEAGGTGQTPQSDFDTMVVTVQDGDPFNVVTPAAWGSGTTQTLFWNIAATNVLPVNCQTVNIKFSIDGGVTWPTTLATATANDGSESITVPAVADTTLARVMVEAADNIFYAISDNFLISNAPSFSLNAAVSNQAVCNIDAVSYAVDFFTVNGFNETTTFTAAGNPAGSTVAFSQGTLAADGQTLVDITGLTAATTGDYTITITAASASVTKTIDLTLSIADGLCASVANTLYDTSTTLVSFESINNASGKPSGYSDYTAISTDVYLEQSYPITINQNTDGNYTCYSAVWIDWNQNCLFDTAEFYDLGSVANVTDGPSSNSGLMVTVPADALLGNTTMRVTTKYGDLSDSCENSHDAEVEDYTVNVLAQLSVDEFGVNAFFNVYPNPNNGSFNVRLNTVNSEDVEISVFDIRGRSVFAKRYQSNQDFNKSINLGSVQSGMYMLQVSNGVSTQTKKIIVN